MPHHRGHTVRAGAIARWGDCVSRPVHGARAGPLSIAWLSLDSARAWRNSIDPPDLQTGRGSGPALFQLPALHPYEPDRWQAKSHGQMRDASNPRGTPGLHCLRAICPFHRRGGALIPSALPSVSQPAGFPPPPAGRVSAILRLCAPATIPSSSTRPPRPDRAVSSPFENLHRYRDQT